MHPSVQYKTRDVYKFNVTQDVLDCMYAMIGFLLALAYQAILVLVLAM
jgi:hypothetical protein